MCFLKLLKKTIIISFVLISGIQLNAQDSVYNHNGFMLDVSFMPVFGDEIYFPAGRPMGIPSQYSKYLVTDVPGHYYKSNPGYRIAINYNHEVYRNIYLKGYLSYVHNTYNKWRSIDSVEYYYMFPDTIKPYIPYDIANSYINQTSKNHYFNCALGISYYYKRFGATLNVFTGLIEINEITNEYKNRGISKSRNCEYFPYIPGYLAGLNCSVNVELSFLLLKNYFPTYLYISFSRFSTIGLRFNMSKIDL